MAKEDIKQQVTDRIVAALELGTAPWVQSWTGGKALGMPTNLSTGKAYRGVNVPLLWMARADRNFTSDEWSTYKQAAEKGGQVRKGETGTRIIFWRIIDKGVDENGNEQKMFLLRQYTAFNRDQIDGLPEVEVVEVSEAERHARADAMIEAAGAKVSYGSSRASYSPTGDNIQMPAIEQFDDEGSFYATLIHEHAHWTGHPTRLNRDLSGGFGSSAYGGEELIAELASAFVCATLGIEGKLQHAEYLSSWISTMKADKNALFSAMSKAGKAADFLTAYEEVELEAAA
jgi:antirestriction protein ArdC